MLKTRIITALLALPLFAVVLFAGKPVFVAGWTILTLLAALEWNRLTARTREQSEDLLFMGVRLLALAALMVYAPAAGQWLLWLLAVPALVFWWQLVPAQLRRYGEDGHLDTTHALWPWASLWVFDTFVLGSAYLYVTLGSARMLGLLALVWCADTGAYTFGRLFGKRPLAPAISPKKTREGFVGGCVTAVLGAWVYAVVCDVPGQTVAFVLVSALVVAFSTVGDLWESVLKRARGVKDSGTILPGHGGMLDRIDSWLPSMLLWALWFSLFV